jgi:RHS repeat-associated protein
VAGHHISMGGADSWLAHADAINSTTMVTDQTGAVVWDQVFGPWGQNWQQTGTRPWFVFAGLRWPVNDPLKPSATREFSSNVFRWMTPDPGGRKVVEIDDPQTWNMYAYVTNNPTSLNDPNGLCAGGPLGWATAGYCGMHLVPWGNGAGAVVGGYDIFDALEGAAGTFLTNTAPGFGFSITKWYSDERAQEVAYENSPAYLDAVNAQLAAVIAALEAKGKEHEEIMAFEGYLNQNFSRLYLGGGNVNFPSYGQDPLTGKSFSFAFGCPKGRCDLGALGALDFHHHGGRTFHLDTSDPWTSWRGFAIHAWVDIFLGNVGYYVIPRPWTW